MMRQVIDKFIFEMWKLTFSPQCLWGYCTLAERVLNHVGIFRRRTTMPKKQPEYIATARNSNEEHRFFFESNGGFLTVFLDRRRNGITVQIPLPTVLHLIILLRACRGLYKRGADGNLETQSSNDALTQCQRVRLLLLF